MTFQLPCGVFSPFAGLAIVGSEGVIAENDPAAQRKTIRYNHLIANCVIFYNVCAMTRVLHNLAQGAAQ